MEIGHVKNRTRAAIHGTSVGRVLDVYDIDHFWLSDRVEVLRTCSHAFEAHRLEQLGDQIAAVLSGSVDGNIW